MRKIKNLFFYQKRMGKIIESVQLVCWGFLPWGGRLPGGAGQCLSMALVWGQHFGHNRIGQEGHGVIVSLWLALSSLTAMTITWPSSLEQDCLGSSQLQCTFDWLDASSSGFLTHSMPQFSHLQHGHNNSIYFQGYWESEMNRHVSARTEVLGCPLRSHLPDLVKFLA